MKNRYLNLWREETIVLRPEYYENDSPCLGEHRGVKAFRPLAGGIQFVLAGVCITHLNQQGKVPDWAPVDDLLDGVNYKFCSDKVAKHLHANGFPNAKAY